MANDWIKMRPGMANHAKVTVMSRRLLANDSFRAWFLGDAAASTPRDATNTVTFSVVTRVTVAALLDVWGAINHVVKDDDRVGFMTTDDVDQIAGVPGFADAMQAVDWLRLDEDESLVFPNFGEFNTPESERKKPKTAAQRAKEYRERKRAEEQAESDRHDRHETSRGSEQSREEVPLCPDAGARESTPAEAGPSDDPDVDAATAAHQASRPAAVASDKALVFGEVVTVLNAYGVPHTFAIGKGRPYILEWVRAGVMQADLANAFARACENKRDGPIGPAYLDPIVKQVVNERLNPSERGDHHAGRQRNSRGNASAVARALEDD